MHRRFVTCTVTPIGMTREQGFPSVGDVHSTVPVAKEKWFEYGGERSGRFQVRRLPPAAAPCLHSLACMRLISVRPKKAGSSEWGLHALEVSCCRPTHVGRGRYFHKEWCTARRRVSQNPDGSMKTECGIHVAR